MRQYERYKMEDERKKWMEGRRRVMKGARGKTELRRENIKGSTVDEKWKKEE